MLPGRVVPLVELFNWAELWAGLPIDPGLVGPQAVLLNWMVLPDPVFRQDTGRALW